MDPLVLRPARSLALAVHARQLKEQAVRCHVCITVYVPARLDPDVAAALMVAAGVVPLEPYPGAAKPWRCSCNECGAEVAPRYSDVSKGNGGCRACGNHAKAARMQLDDAAATLTMTNAGFEPLEPYPGSNRPWRCRCQRCGSVGTPQHSNVKQGWLSFRTCRGAASSLRQRGSEAAAIEAMRAVGLEPLEPYQGVMSPWRSQCHRCGEEVSPPLNNIRKGQGGCRWCAGVAVDQDEAAEVMRSAGLEPLISYPGRHSPWPSKCRKCGRTVSPRYGAVNSEASDPSAVPSSLARLRSSEMSRP
jgi:hypothetical protein